MAYSLENTTDLVALGNAIRAKTGDTNTMTVAQMATAVDGISGGGVEFEDEELLWGESDGISYTASTSAKLGGKAFKLLMSKVPKNKSMILYTNNSFDYLFQYQQVDDLSQIKLQLNSEPDGGTIPSNKFILIRGMFQDNFILEHLPNISKLPIQANFMRLFTNCAQLTDNEINNFIPYDVGGTTGLIMTQAFYGCSKLQNITPFLSYIYRKIYDKNISFQNNILGPSNDMYSFAFSYDNHLQEILLPVPGSSVSSTNTYIYPIRGLYSLKKLKYLTDTNGNSLTANMINKSILISQLYTYSTSSNILNKPIICDETSYNLYKNNVESIYLSGQNPSATHTIDGNTIADAMLYHGFNHDAMVELINSLPDVSAYGTNTIKISQYYGRLTDEGGVDTITAAEAAVASAKGWTITFTTDTN